MNHYKFKNYNREHDFIWQNEDLKVVFSKGSFQAFDDFGYVKSIDEIMYLYYTVSVYTKSYEYNKKNGKKIAHWNLVSEGRTYDFPTLRQLVYILETMINDDIDIKDCRRITYYTRNNKHEMVPSGRYGYEFSLESEGFETDDFYQITRLLVRDEDDSFVDGEKNDWGMVMKHDKDNVSYTLYIGTSFGQKPLASAGVRYPNLTINDLKSLYDCVMKFFDDLINTSNASLIERNKNYISSLSIKDKTLFVANEKDATKLDEMLLIGDKFDSIECIVGDMDSEDFYSISYNCVEITDMSDTSIFVTNGYVDKNDDIERLEGKIVKIPINTIVYLFSDRDSDDETNLVCLLEDELVDDFFGIMTDSIKEEFRTQSFEFLHNKWSEVLVNRSYMFRDEHNFPKYKEDRRENIEYITGNIIKKIVKKL